MMAEKEQGFRKMLEKSIVENIKIEHKVVLKGQYEKAYKLLNDSLDAGLTPTLVGPPGVGKSLLDRKVAEDTGRSFRDRDDYDVGSCQYQLSRAGRQDRSLRFSGETTLSRENHNRSAERPQAGRSEKGEQEPQGQYLH